MTLGTSFQGIFNKGSYTLEIQKTNIFGFLMVNSCWVVQCFGFQNWHPKKLYTVVQFSRHCSKLWPINHKWAINWTTVYKFQMASDETKPFKIQVFQKNPPVLRRFEFRTTTVLKAGKSSKETIFEYSDSMGDYSQPMFYIPC